MTVRRPPALALLTISELPDTPLKRRTPPPAGAVFGAMPVLIGRRSGWKPDTRACYFSRSSSLAVSAFHAIAWMYREDYARALKSSTDPKANAGWQSLVPHPRAGARHVCTDGFAAHPSFTRLRNTVPRLVFLYFTARFALILFEPLRSSAASDLGPSICPWCSCFRSLQV
jgi:hypothetical protein